jgi:hypothetical protein
MKLFLSPYYYLLQRCFLAKIVKHTTALFLDSVSISTNTMKYLNPNDIESINSIKKDTVITAAIQDRYISVLKS